MLLALLSACSRQPRAVPVEIKAFKFVPAEVHARPGDTLVVTNHDMVPHTATAIDKKWDTGTIPADSTARVVVGAHGEFICTLHPTMTGSLKSSD